MTKDPLHSFHEAISVLGLNDALGGFLNYEFSNQKGWKNWWCGMGGGDWDRMNPNKRPPGFNKVLSGIGKDRCYCRIIENPYEFLRRLYFFLFGCEPHVQSTIAASRR